MLFVLAACIWLVVNCQEDLEMRAVMRLTEAADIREHNVYENIIVNPMKEPTKEATIVNIVQTSKSPEKFCVLRMPQNLKKVIPWLTSLLTRQECLSVSTSTDWFPKVTKMFEFSDKFSETFLQKAIYETISDDHSNWIFSLIGTHLLTKTTFNTGRAHIDFLRDTDIEDLLKDYGKWSVDLMVNLAKNADVKSAALNHYNGNVERCAIDILKIEHLMNIWIPTKPVKSWPLVLTPATQCGPTRTTTFPFVKGGKDSMQALLKSDSIKNDWYTRLNMQPDEVYVWDSRTVAHTAVKIGDGEGERSSIVSRLLILTPKDGSFPDNIFPKYDTLCYTERLFNQVKSVYKLEDQLVELFLKKKGYSRPCPSLLSTLCCF